MVKKKSSKKKRRSNALKWGILAAVVLAVLMVVGLGGQRLWLAVLRVQHHSARAEATRLRNARSWGQPPSDAERAADKAASVAWMRRRQWGGPYEGALHASEQIPEMIVDAVVKAHEVMGRAPRPGENPRVGYGNGEWIEYKSGTFSVDGTGFSMNSQFSFGDTVCECARFVPSPNEVLMVFRMKVPEGVSAETARAEYLRGFSQNTHVTQNRTSRPVTIGSYSGEEMEASSTEGRRARLRCVSKDAVVYCQLMMAEPASTFDAQRFFDSLKILQ